ASVELHSRKRHKDTKTESKAATKDPSDSWAAVWPVPQLRKAVLTYKNCSTLRSSYKVRRELNMRMLGGVIVGIAVMVSIAACAQRRADVAAVADAMGATNLNSIEYSGSGE